MLHKFNYFEPLHIQSFIFYLILTIVIISVPFIIRTDYKGYYTRFLGYFLLFAKIFDIWYRIFIEQEKWFYTIPLNLCNISLIISGLFFIKRSNHLFNLVYFWFTGAILAVILPGIEYYHTRFYVHVFMGTHFLEIMTVIYGFIHLDVRITKNGLKWAILGYIGMCITGLLINNILGTNFMFVNDYIISAVSFIRPFWIYVIILISLFVLSMILTYLPFLHIDNEEIEEKSIN
ncbi:TMEM164-related integral membrane acyltransferase [Caviibacter abscessus]|uniref:TMEM164-related integral membrane acyltransferase n=1 Tax=Caviibacter abscessus TaxID=1766719 RepID=UPI000834F067|nr:TIGR02206 family membrane protein [Caviibacter abscessus]